MKSLAAAMSLAVLAAVGVAAQAKNTKPLEIWVVDVEGGKAALYVTPTGQTAMIDTGFPGARDLDRIMAAIADAGVKQIDYLVSTHYHVDHIGNLVELAKRIPVGTFVDHGPTTEGPEVPQVAPGPDGLTVTKPREQVEGFQAAYAELYGKAKHLVVKPGDRLPITGLDWRIVTAAGKVLKAPALPGGGRPNPYCAGFTPMAGTTGLVDPDDAQSVGSVINWAISGSPGDYLQFALPGIIVQNAIFATLTTGVGLSTDLTKGCTTGRGPADRPVAPPAGRILADTAKQVWRFRCCWASARPSDTGCTVASAGCRRVRSRPDLQPLLLLARGARRGDRGQPGEGADLRLRGRPSRSRSPASPCADRHHASWLQSWVKVNPVTILADGVRGLLDGVPPMPAPSACRCSWALGITAVVAPIAVWRFKLRI